MELWRCAAGVGTSTYGDRELWRHAAGVASKEVRSPSVLFVVVGISSFRSSRLAVCVACQLETRFVCMMNASNATECRCARLPVSPPLPTPRVIRGSCANLSGFAPRQAPLRLAGCPQLLAVHFGGHLANVSGCTLITQGFGA